MTALFIAAPLIAVALLLAWHRIASERAERRSVESYERALDLLGDVTKRSDASAPVQVLGKDEVARPHVRPARANAPAREARAGPRAGVRPIVPPPVLRTNGPLVFGDDDLVGPRATENTPSAPVARPPAAAALHPPVAPSAPAPPDDHEGEPFTGASHRAPRGTSTAGHRTRRIEAGAALVVVLGAVVVGVTLVSGHSPPPAGSGTTHNRTSGSTTTTIAHSTTTTLTPSGELAPTSVSSTVVTFTLSSSAPYQLGFVTSGVAWVGIESSSKGPYLWMKTLGAGETSTYSASGPVVVRLGAPGYLTLSLNGTPVELPHTSQPYDVAFAISSNASTSG
jgi:Domain of unknown function (DUF4115)